MWAVYLINAIYGYINWTRMSRLRRIHKITPKSWKAP